MRTILAVLTATLVTLAAAGGASAATRYAAPAGTGTACTSAAPCGLSQAITAASEGDEVVVGTGSYGDPTPLPTQISGPSALDIHGEAGQPRPKIVFSSTFGLQLGSGSRLADVEVVTTAASTGAAIIAYARLIERVVVCSSGTFTEGIRVMESSAPVIRDTVVVVAGGVAIRVSGPSAFGPVAAHLENVTAIAAGGNPLMVESSSGRPASADVDRSIFRNTGGASDIRLVQSGTPVLLSIRRSSFRTPFTQSGTPGVSLGPGNTAATPLFADAEFHQAPGSPTIDAGGAEPADALDLDLDPRWLGSAVDIGADELRPAPPPPAAAVTVLGASAVGLSGSADTGGLPGTWRVEYGPTSAYGSATSDRPLAALRGAQDLATSLGGLPADADVHYRVVVTTAGGTAVTPDAVARTTAPATVTVKVPGPTKNVVVVPKVTKLTVAKGAATFTLSAAARVTVTVKKGSRTVKRIAKTLKAGKRSIKLGKLKKGKYVVSVQAAQAPAKAATKGFKVS